MREVQCQCKIYFLFYLLQVKQISVLVSIRLGGVQVLSVPVAGDARQPAPGAPRVVDKGELDQGEEDEGGAGPHPDVYRLTSCGTFHLFCCRLSRLRPLTLIGLFLADFIAIYCLRSKPVCPHDIYLYACAFISMLVHESFDV